MADNKVEGAPALDTNIESGGFDEKRAHGTADAPPAAEAAPPKTTKDEAEDDDEDIDALIEDLESQDGHQDEDEDEERTPDGARTVPEDMLQTDSRVGLTESEVTARRRKYGYNRMKEEKENHILKFLGFFVGPIQFVMEVSFNLFLFPPISCPIVNYPFATIPTTITRRRIRRPDTGPSESGLQANKHEGMGGLCAFLGPKITVST